MVAESKKKMGSAKSTDEMSLTDMADVIRSNPKYEEMMKKYHVHMELTNKSITEFTQCNLRKLISLEQDIITGVDAKYAKMNNTSLVKEISQINKLVRDVDYVRLLMIYFICYDLNKKDKDTLLKSVPNENHRQILQNLEYLDAEATTEGKKFRRRRADMTQEQMLEYQRRSSQSDYENIRSEPLICELIKQIQDKKIDTQKYPYVVQKVEQVKKAPAKAKRGAKDDTESKFDRQDVIDNPRIFVFVIGGLSHHEIVSISNL